MSATEHTPETAAGEEAEPNESAPKADRPGRVRRGEEFEAEIETLAYGGRGIARREGYVVFINGGLPGDKVLARVTKSKKGYAEANAIEMVEPSPSRLPDTDIHQAEACPGAPWQALSYETQLNFKEEQVKDALGRIGHLEGFTLDPIVPALEQWRYRNKVEYSFGEQEGQLVLGFHPRGRWDQVLDIEDCKLSSEATNKAKNDVLDWAKSEGLTAYDPHDHRGVLRNLVVREGMRTGQVQTRLVTSLANFPKPPVDLHTTIDGPSGGTTGPTGVLGEATLRQPTSARTIHPSHDSFFQTNTAMAEKLYSVAREFSGLTGAETLFDLYCGVGTIGLSMASEAKKVWGLEIVKDAITNAKRNAITNNIANAKFVAANARTGLGPLIEEAGKPDVITIDPPRGSRPVIN